MDVYAGQVTALLGHNGAAKTTTMWVLFLDLICYCVKLVVIQAALHASWNFSSAKLQHTMIVKQSSLLKVYLTALLSLLPELCPLSFRNMLTGLLEPTTCIGGVSIYNFAYSNMLKGLHKLMPGYACDKPSFQGASGRFSFHFRELYKKNIEYIRKVFRCGRSEIFGKKWYILEDFRELPEDEQDTCITCMLNIWAVSWQNQQTVGPMKISLDIHPVSSESSLCAQWVAKDPSFLHVDSKDWSDWADAQVDLSLRWAHMPFCWFCHEAAHFFPYILWG